MDYLRIIIITFTLLPFLTVSGQSFAQEEEVCCLRQLATGLIKVPEGTGESLASSIDDTLLSRVRLPTLDHCPLRIEIWTDPAQVHYKIEELMKKFGEEAVRDQYGGRTDWIQYQLQGNLTVQETDRKNGEIVGNWTLEVKVVDRIRGDTVNSGTCSWKGKDYNGQEQVRALGSSLLGAIDDVIYRYEGMPTSAVLHLEKQPVTPGTQVRIQLANISSRAGQGNLKPWQQVLVRADKGKILNGAKNGAYRRFNVGNGQVEIHYLAPDKCKEGDCYDYDRVTVFNSCMQSPPNDRILPEEVIAISEIEIDCMGSPAESSD